MILLIISAPTMLIIYRDYIRFGLKCTNIFLIKCYLKSCQLRRTVIIMLFTTGSTDIQRGPWKTFLPGKNSGNI